MSNIIIPKRLPGFIELDPEKQQQFNVMKRKIEEVFEKHCFLPLDTPVLELSEILLAKSGGDVDKEIYRFTKGSTDMCMRYDLTVPLARYVAMNLNELNFPFKRYQIGKVFRGEKPQKGRLREFYQCDADVIGFENLSLLNDAECVNLFVDCFKALNLDVVVEISNRKLIGGLISSLNLENFSEEIFKNLDKLDKLGKEKVAEILNEEGINANDCKTLLEFAQIKGSLDFVLEKLSSTCNNETFMEGLNELKELDSYLTTIGLTEKNYTYNLSIIRGHNYYTGTVFEAYLNNHRDFGAVGAGGRYDNLASYYTDKRLPGVGMSIGLSRLFDQLSSNNLLAEEKNLGAQLLIIPMGETLLECIKICKSLQEAYVKADILSENKSFKSKLKEANKRNIPYVLIVGEEEVSSKKYTLKNMQTGQQEALDINEIIKNLSHKNGETS